MHSLYMCMICLNHRDELDRLILDSSIVDEKDRSQCFNHRDELSMHRLAVAGDA